MNEAAPFDFLRFLAWCWLHLIAERMRDGRFGKWSIVDRDGNLIQQISAPLDA